jgi:hypothetical protein
VYDSRRSGAQWSGLAARRAHEATVLTIISILAGA